jgi:hypothetical protein
MLHVCTAGRRFMYDGKEERGRMSTIVTVSLFFEGGL